MAYLSQDQINELISAVLALPTSYDMDRLAFLAGIEPGFRALLQGGLAPMAQLLFDLNRFNNTPRLASGQVPLHVWLNNATLQATATEQETIFRRHLDEVGHLSSGAPRVSLTGVPELKEQIVHVDDMVLPMFLENGLKAAASVARLAVPRHENGMPRLLNGKPMLYLGTGWLLTPTLLITNQHIINARSDNETPAEEADLGLQALGTLVKFDYDSDALAGTDTSVVALEAYAPPPLDYAILRLPPTHRPGLTRAPAALQMKPGDYIPVNIIQHPGGGGKRFAIRNNLVTATTDTAIRYFTDTREGSSGSAVCDDRWEVVGLHCGATYAENVSFQGRRVAYVNVGTQIMAILADLAERFPTLAEEVEDRASISPALQIGSRLGLLAETLSHRPKLETSMSDYSVLKNDSLDLDLAIAVFLAEAAQAAYGRIGPHDPSPNDDVETPSDWAALTGFGTAHTFDNGNVQGFWCIKDAVALLAFRGTSNPRQWLRDARFFPAPYPWGWLHVGFRNGLNAQTAALQEFLATAATAKVRYLWVTGHSLGGALAVIAASKLKLLDDQVAPPRVYTYGQPRVGLDAFADRFAEELPNRLVRFINQSDIVPRVPIDPIYRHTGIPKHIVAPGVIELAVVEATPLLSEEQLERVEALKFAFAKPAAALAPEMARSFAGIDLLNEDPAALTPEQFAELQYGLGANPAEGEATAEVPEGAISIPAFEDHAIGNYILMLEQLAAGH